MENLCDASEQVQHEIHSISNRSPTPQPEVSRWWHDIDPTLLDSLLLNDWCDDHCELTLLDDDMPCEWPTFNHYYEFQKCINVIYTMVLTISLTSINSSITPLFNVASLFSFSKNCIMVVPHVLTLLVTTISPNKKNFKCLMHYTTISWCCHHPNGAPCPA